VIIDGYEWHDVSTVGDVAAGKRVLLRGAPADPNVAKLEGLKAAIESRLDAWEVYPQRLRSLDVVQVIREVVRQHG
jgi:hypothetical protein